MKFFRMLVALALLSPVAALAQQAVAPPPPQPGQGGMVRMACRDDAHRLCEKVEPGQGRILRCLLSRPDALSVGCRNALAAMRDRQPQGGAPPPRPAPAH